ncbi:MAG TPA: methyltransferase domain-containing protein [Chloroflexia bacterium]|jgi:ubiquinone/menaquinone biosynthesis C-methylase UbiE
MKSGIERVRTAGTEGVAGARGNSTGFRTQFGGALQILQYNGPFYAKTLLGCAVAAVAAAKLPLPQPVKALVRLGIGGACYFSVASLVASWWVYDHSHLTRWRWIAELLPTKPKRWANIHAGLDETTLALRALFPDTESVVLDIYDPREMTEPSIKRAREISPAPVVAITADVKKLPVEDGALNALFLIFAAHEVRDKDLRRTFFRELHRVLAPQGTLLLVEHVRDVANFAAFGPGFMHFLPRSEWQNLGNLSGLQTRSHFRITPFVNVWVFEKPGFTNMVGPDETSD